MVTPGPLKLSVDVPRSAHLFLGKTNGKIEVEDRTAEVAAATGHAAPPAPATPKSAAAIEAAETAEQVRQARMKGYEGDPCPNCASFTLVRNGSCLKCVSCGGTTGCT